MKLKKNNRNSPLHSAPTWQANNLLEIPSVYKHEVHRYGKSHRIAIEQKYEYGIGGVLWDCEIVLASFMTLSDPPSGASGKRSGKYTFPMDFFQNKKIVELGCGTALAALAAWCSGGTVIATDLPEIIQSVTTPIVNQNIANCDKSSQKRMKCMDLAWGNTVHQEAVVAALGGCPDITIAADVLYLHDQYEPLLCTLDYLIPDAKSMLIFVHRQRMDHQELFLGPLNEMFVIEHTVPVQDIIPSYPKPTLVILLCRRKQGP